ncbi:MAG: DUF1952 domain-containing protein [Chloroflexota bacterium]
MTDDGATATFSVVVRAIPIWLLRSYLEETGGVSGTDGVVVGDGWAATLEQVEDFAVGSLRVGQVRLSLEGTPGAVLALRDALAPRLVRGGG